MTRHGAACSRREALGLMASAAALTVAGPPALAAAPAGRPARPGRVTAYFNDGLLADPSATLPAFRRPAGYRGTRRLARMSEAELIAAGITL